VRVETRAGKKAKELKRGEECEKGVAPGSGVSPDHAISRKGKLFMDIPKERET